MSMDDVMKIRNEKLKECLIDNIDRPPVNMGRLAALTTQIRTQMPDDGISGGILNSLTSSNHKPMELITPIRIKKILNEEEGGGRMMFGWNWGWLEDIVLIPTDGIMSNLISGLFWRR